MISLSSAIGFVGLYVAFIAGGGTETVELFSETSCDEPGVTVDKSKGKDPIQKTVLSIIETANSAASIASTTKALKPLLVDLTKFRVLLSKLSYCNQRSLYVALSGIDLSDEKRAKLFMSLIATDSTIANHLLMRDRIDLAVTLAVPPVFFNQGVPYFGYGDDLMLAEYHIKSLGVYVKKKAEPLKNPFTGIIVNTAEVRERVLFITWGKTCALIDRQDLLLNSTPNNWRGKHVTLNKWFQQNRRFMYWNKSKQRFTVDKNAKKREKSVDAVRQRIPKVKLRFSMPE